MRKRSVRFTKPPKQGNWELQGSTMIFLCLVRGRVRGFWLHPTKGWRSGGEVRS